MQGDAGWCGNPLAIHGTCLQNCLYGTQPVTALRLDQALSCVFAEVGARGVLLQRSSVLLFGCLPGCLWCLVGRCLIETQLPAASARCYPGGPQAFCTVQAKYR